MIYWIQEATQAGAQGAASSWWGTILLSAGVIGAVLSLIGVVIGQYLTGHWHHQDLRQAEQGQITDRFSKAIDQLGSAKPEIQLGGIYALERIARDSPERDYSAVMEVLSAYVRSQPPDALAEGERDKAHEPQKLYSGRMEPPPTIRAIMHVIMRLNGKEGGVGKEYLESFRLDLHETNLRGAYIYGAELQRAYLYGADLEGALLFGANLRKAELQGADLTGAKISPTSKSTRQSETKPRSSQTTSSAPRTGVRAAKKGQESPETLRSPY